MKKHLCSRLLSLVLAAVMVLGLFPAVSAAPGHVSWRKSRADISWDKTDRLAGEELNTLPAHKPTDMVRVSIVLEDAPTLQAGYATVGIGSNAAARAYDRDLQRVQNSVADAISAQALGGKELDVVWNLTLAVNIISANVPYGRIDAIRAVEGVKDVVQENRYEAETAASPDLYSSAGMVGSPTVWQTGLTGAGTRVAIVDTGTDTDHQSFDNGAYLYALAENAAAKGLSVEEYTASLDLLDTAEIAAVLENLNAVERVGYEEAADYYINEKLPFGANYVDYNLDVTHDNDYQGSHGSHVAGIAAANRYVEQGGDYVSAREAVFMNGVAPDAQIITLKVFGNAAGPFDSDYFAAIEDAIWLGCDSVNLSLGSGAPGSSRSTKFQELLDFLTTTDTVVVMSAGNSGYWAEETATGYLYNDGVSFQTNGEPGSYTNSLAVASVDNDGTVGNFLDVAGRMIVYTESVYRNDPITILDTSPDGSGTAYDYIFIDGVGKPEDYAGIDLTGKVVFCHRGEISFYEKATNAVSEGALATIICNNVEGPFGMDLTDYAYTAPCVSILMSDGEAVRAASTRQTTAEGNVYYTGTITISGKLTASEYHSDYYTMSTFSSWGVPGSLELKPEITAPGGQIWSVNGVDTSGAAYELMSGTSMAAPQITGMAALVSEYIQSNGLDAQTGLSVRQLAQSLLMSTAVPLREAASEGEYYSILNQGAGLARVDLAVAAESYIEVFGQHDGKVKAELGDDPERTGKYTVEFTIHNMNGKAMTYALRADLFTQNVFDGGNALYLDTWTRTLPATAEFSSMGSSLNAFGSDFACDLNGDGITNTADADYLLEYVLDNSLQLHADADVNGDGTVNTYDAHVLLTRQTGSYAIDVPANGSARVRVDMELTDEAKEFLDTYYPTGAYIESYIYAEPVSDSEGAQGVTHSIPVLGYYGSWSEPSMYDVGGYVEYLAGAETRAPYLYELNNVRSNFVTINYGDGSEYVFGGNPYVEEAEYLPQRNAFNNTNGAMLQNLRFTQIRNAAASAIALFNVTDNEEIFFEEHSGIDGAYYHANQGAWQNTQYRQALGLDFVGIPEGTRLELSLISAPEYYTRHDEDTDSTGTAWNQLKDGAYLTTAFTIDNTAPELLDMQLGENNTLSVTARDNEYIAAVALMNQSGSSMLTAVPGNQTEKNAQLTVELDLSGIFGEKFLLAVCDYAENQQVYEITLELNNARPYFTAIDRTNVNDDQSVSYVGMDADGSVLTLASNAGRDLARAAEYVEGAVFEASNDNKLYVGMDDDLFSMAYLCDLDPAGEWSMVGMCDLAYNRADGRLYGLFYSELNDMAMPYLCTIDLYTGAMTVLGEMPIDANSMTIDGEGNFYSAIYGASQLYTYTADVCATGKATFVGQLGGFKTTKLNSMAWDHNTDTLYWACNGDGSTQLLKIDPDTAAVELVTTFDFNAVGLYIAYEPENDLFAPTDAVISVTVDENASLLAGTRTRFTARVLPWNVSNDAVTWTTSDASVATVDESGMVRGVGAGTAVITATSVLDPSKSGSCTVDVTALNRELKGLIWDEEGQVWWSGFNTDTLPAYEQLSAVDLPVNATMMADGTLYASTLDTANGVSDLYTVDPATYEMTLVGPSSAGYLDMAYSPSMGYGLATYFNYVVLVDLESGDYLGAWPWADGGAANLVGITYYSSEYNADYQAMMDFFLILDTDGNVYLEAFMSYDGDNYVYFNGPEGGFVRNIGKSVDYDYFQGFHFDGEYVYWTRFSENENVVELIVWDCEITDNVYSLGHFPDGVWPVGGLYTDAELTGTNALIDETMTTAAAKTTELLTTIPTVELTGAKGSLNSVKPDSSASFNDFDGQIEVAVTMPEDATNGIVTIAYDTTKLRSSGAAPATDAMAYVDNGDGTITIAFADGTAVPAGQIVAYALFWGNTPVQATTEVTVRTTELNTGAAALEEKVSVLIPHLNCPSAHFEDVDPNQWYHAAVDFVVEKGWIKGLEADKFGPNDTMNRAQFVTILYRMEGKPAANNTHIFDDIADGEYYTDAVYWALESGITAGATESTFEPYGLLSRSQLVSFMYRYARYKGYDISADGDLSGYADADEIQSYAVTAWRWSIAHRIVSGYDAHTLAPMDLTNRSQAAAIFQRFAKNFMN